MNILHNPITNIQAIIDSFEEDGDLISYVCTTELPQLENRPIDIFYRTSGIPHPKFGNLYFGIFYTNNSLVICNADSVTTLLFDLLPTPNGYVYSRYRHDFIQEGADFIDGGRAYTRANKPTVQAKVINGKLEMYSDVQ